MVVKKLVEDEKFCSIVELYIILPEQTVYSLILICCTVYSHRLSLLQTAK